MGSRCLFVTLVSGWRRLPVPPASTTPFMGLSASFSAQSLLRTSAFFLPGITVGPALSRLPLTVARWKQRNGCVKRVHSAFSVNGCFSQGIQLSPPYRGTFSPTRRTGVTVVFSGPTQFGGRVVVEEQFPVREIEQSKSGDPQLPELVLQRGGQHPESILHAPSEID